MNSLYLVMAALWIAGTWSTALRSAERNCEEIWSKIPQEYGTSQAQTGDKSLDEVSVDRPRLNSKYFDLSPPASWKVPLHKLRDAIRHRLQIFHKHPYPVVAIDEAPAAHWWAKGAFAKLNTSPPSEAGVKAEVVAKVEPFDAKQIGSELNAYLEHLEHFGSEMETLIDAAANNEIKIASLRKLLQSNEKNFGIRATLPKWVRRDGKLVLDKEETYFGTSEKIEIELSAQIAERQHLSNAVADRVLNQAIMVKKIETYMHELLQQVEEHKGQELPAEFDGFLKRARSLYEDKELSKLKGNIKPPTWAWQKLKWMQLGAEASSIFTKDIRILREKYDESQLKQIVDYFKTLSTEERRALGIGDITTAGVKWWENYKWARVVAALVSSGATFAGAGGPAAVKSFLDTLFLKDVSLKEGCADKDSEEDYLDCVVEYLNEKYKGRYMASRADLQRIFSTEGSASDPVIASEIEDIARRRNLRLNERYADGILNQKTRVAVETLSVGSPLWKENLIQREKEADFKEGLLHPDPQKGYLQLRYGALLSQPSVRSLLNEVIEASTSMKRNDSMRKLAEISGTEEMAKDLNEIFELRAKHINEIKIRNSASRDTENAAAHLLRPPPAIKGDKSTSNPKPH